MKILIVEDNIADVLYLKKALEEANGAKFAISNLQTLAQAKECLEKEDFDVVALDLGLSDSWGIETFIRLQNCARDTPIVILSGLDDESLAIEAVRLGAQDYLVKDLWNPHRISRSLVYAIERPHILSGILSTCPVGMCFAREREIIWANDAWLKMFGFETEREIRGQSTRSLYSFVEEYDRIGSLLDKSLRTGGIIETEARFRRKDGSDFDARIRIKPIDACDPSKGVISAVSDISDLKQAEKQIEGFLEEKEVLLREIQHRVNNNLAIICGLLNLQCGNVKDETHLKMFEGLEARVMSMAMAHEKVYAAENLANLDVPEYVDELVDHLVGLIKPGTAIQLRKEINDVSFGLDTAIPFGFILTELVSNSLKHGFPDGKEGEIQIVLQSIGDNQFELLVRDDGVGVQGDAGLENRKSSGLELAHAFVDKLKGSMEISRDHGTRVRVRFRRI
jgi:PAS domain S-box-containing protein